MEPKARFDAIASDRTFFTALIAADTETLRTLLTDDFVLIDVMRRGEISKAMLLAAVESSQVRFDAIEPADVRVRRYQSTAVVNGRTKMRGHFGVTPFEVLSRYTHVFVLQEGRLRLASAQGTQIVEN
jgi:hypothetical protein